MALLNVAYAMAAKGRHVLVLDMDLEAPGLSGFLRRHGEIGALAGHDMVDLVRWASDLSRVFTASEPMDAGSFPPLTDFVIPVLPERLEPLPHPYSDLGRVDIIPVDEERDYYQRLTDLAIGGFDHDALVSVGSVLRAWLKSRRFAVDVPDYYGPNAERTAAYDYVLVDSRTGISETGGLCIGPLSDQVVVLTALNDQNVAGTRRFLEEVGILAKPPSTPATDGPGEERPVQRLDPKPTLIVASPVPAGEIATKRERLSQLAKSIGQAVVKLSYHPQMALLESIFTRDFRDEYLAREYDALLQQILQMASDGIDLSFLENSIRSTRASPDEWRESARLALRVASAMGQEILSLLLWTAPAAEAISEDVDFILQDRVCRVLSGGEEPTHFDVLNTWANILSQWTLLSTSADLARLRWQAAMDCYGKVVGSERASALQKGQALVSRGVAYGKLHEPAKAMADLTGVIQMPGAPAKQKAQALVSRGVAYGKLHEPAKKMADYTAVIEMPDAPPEQKAQALVIRGATYNAMNDSEKAITDFTAVIQMSDAPPEQKAKALNTRGAKYGQLDKLEKAITDFTAVIQMPDAPPEQKATALNTRGVMYSHLDKPEKAMADYTAVIQMPDAPPKDKAAALSHRGWAYFISERYREAIDDEQQAVTLDSKNCTARGNLAIALLVDGQTNDALAAYDSALAIADVKDVEVMATDLDDAMKNRNALPGVEEARARLEARRIARNGDSRITPT